MNKIVLKNISLEYPIYDYSKQSLKLTTLKYLTGGNIIKNKNSAKISALKNINLTASDGDRIGLYGHNGSGKTTLLRVIAGIYEPSSGTRVIEGNIASMLTINFGINQFETGLENIKLKAKFLKLDKQETNNLINYITSFSDLGEYLNMPLTSYSSGMLVRLQFALATYNISGIVVLDEWLSAGDDNFAPKAEKKMQEIVINSGVLVIASHNIKLLKKICNKIIYLEKGEISKIEKT